MFNLTNQEKQVLIVLCAFAVLGLAVLSYSNYFSRPKLEVIPSQIKINKADYEDVFRQKRMVNINTADINKIKTLPDIGPKLANDIVDYRSTHGPFLLKDDLLKVKGIGLKKFEGIKEYILLE